MKKKEETGLTVDKINSKFDAYKRLYGQLHTDQKLCDDYYELGFDPDVPDDYPTLMTDTARNWVDAGVRHYTLDNPKSTAYLRNDSDKARDEAAIKEIFMNFWMTKDILTIKQVAKKLLKRGEAFLKFNMDNKYIGSKDEQRLFHFPFFTTGPDPINVYCSPAHDGLVPHDVFEDFKITMAEAEAMCERNGWTKPTGGSADKFISWRMYHDADVRCFLLDDKPVLTPAVQKNILGFCPYVHIDAGFGDEHHEGKPEYRYRSILWGKRDMLKLEVRNLSQTDAIIGRYAWPRYKAILGSANTDVIKQVYPDGKVPTDPAKWLIDVKDQLETAIQTGEQPPPALFQQLAMIKEYASPPTVLSGGRPTGVYSGQHQETLISTAKPIYKEPFKNFEDGLGVLMGMGFRTAEKVYNYDIHIKNFADKDSKRYWVIKPSDINGNYDCDVHLLAEPPEATDARKYLGANLRKGGSISERTELKDYHDMSEQEVTDELAQKWAERGLSSIGALDVMARDAMSRLGMEKELEALDAAQQNAAKNIPPPKQGEGVSKDLEERATTTPTRVEGELAE